MNVSIACPCPGTPHPDGDTATLRDKLDFLSGRAIRFEVGLLMAEGPVPSGLMLAKLSEQYLLYGIEAWSLIDEQGKAIAPLRSAIGRFMAEHGEQAEVVADAADGLYSADIVGPLVARAEMSSPPTPTEPSTSATTPSSPTPLKPSKRSSTTSTPTDGTATTSASPAGGSSSSRNSASAA